MNNYRRQTVFEQPAVFIWLQQKAPLEKEVLPVENRIILAILA